MNPFFVTDFSISDSLKTVRKSVLIYETIIERQGAVAMSKIIDDIAKDLKAISETLKAKTAGVDKKKLILMNLPYILAGYFCKGGGA